MARLDAHVRRFKSLSLTMLAATWLTYNVFDTGQMLQVDLADVEKLFFAVSLVGAEAPERGAIERVNGISADDWRRDTGLDPLPPRRGKIVDLILMWEENSLPIAGSFQLSNGESVKFERLPLFTRSSDMRTVTRSGGQSDLVCPASTKFICQLFSLQHSNQLEPYKIMLVYVSRGAFAGDGNWYYSQGPNGDLISFDEIRSQIVGIASKWATMPKSAEDGYIRMREEPSLQTVRVPIIGLEVGALQAAIYLSLFAFVVSIITVHSIMNIVNIPVKTIEEPWIILVPDNQATGWAANLQNLISRGASVVLLSVLWCPVLIIGLSIRMGGEGAEKLALIILLVITIFVAVASTIQFWFVLRQINNT